MFMASPFSKFNEFCLTGCILLYKSSKSLSQPQFPISLKWTVFIEM